MPLMANYEQAILRGEIHDDRLQREVVNALQEVVDALESPRYRWSRPLKKKDIKGLYLHGPVGAGKTFLMDLFYQHVLERRKSRVHFHQFMQQVDGQLRRLQGHSEPLKRIAENLAKTTHLLCLDEFLVQDVATAMVLAELLKHMFSRGMVLVITSNTRPEDLYLNGLQRVRFIPAIELIKHNCNVLDLADPRDYRLGREPLEKAYLWPLSSQTQQAIAQQFDSIVLNTSSTAVEENTVTSQLVVQGRVIPFVKCVGRVVWFKFDVICNLPRSQLDYLEIANRFDTVFVTDIPVLTANDTVRALLLTHFIDVMYDRRARVIISAAVPIDHLYIEGEVLAAFQRTRSRLEEMQSADYAHFAK